MTDPIEVGKAFNEASWSTPHPLDSTYVDMSTPLLPHATVWGHFHMGHLVTELRRTLTLEQIDYVIMRLQEAKAIRIHNDNIGNKPIKMLW